MVIDAGVVVAALTERAGRGAEAREQLRRSRRPQAPHLLDLEVGSALRGLVRGGKLEAAAAHTALGQMRSMPVRRHPHEPLLERAWELRDNLTFYDAAYVALAELLEVPFLTTDRRIGDVTSVACDIRVLRG